MNPLEQKLEEAFEQFGIDEKGKRLITTYLTLLRIKHQPTYQHSIRTGLLSVRMGEYLKLDTQALFFAGNLHDIGKLFIKQDVVEKDGEFTTEDMETMKSHSEYGYGMLKPTNEFTAEVVLRVHRHQKGAYPEILPGNSFSEHTKLMIEKYSVILSTADFYDTIKYRAKEKLKEEDVRRRFVEKKPKQRELIEEMYSAGIFGGNGANL